MRLPCLEGYLRNHDIRDPGGHVLLASRRLRIPHPIYFAQSYAACGGTAGTFVDVGVEARGDEASYGRAYLVSRMHFGAIYRAENAEEAADGMSASDSRATAEPPLDWDELLRLGEARDPHARYGLVKMIGTERHRPILLLTTPKEGLERARPADGYLTN